MTKLQIKKVLDRVRKICLSLPEVNEVEAWGHPTFRAPKKMFAAMGGEKDGSASLGLLVGFDRQDELLTDARFFPTPYAAHRGWVTLRLQPNMDWDEVAALAQEAYRQVAHKRLIKVLDAK